MSRGTGHYGGASMALPMAAVVVIGLAMLAPIVLMFIGIGVVIVAVCALAAGWR